MKHQHRPVEGTLRGQTSGGVPSRCALVARNKPCPYIGAHVIKECRCGATGVSCPSTKRTCWTEAQ